MPPPVQVFVVIVAATVVYKVVRLIVSILLPQVATITVSDAAERSKAGMEHLVREAQELLLPFDEVPPTGGRGGTRTAVPALTRQNVSAPRTTKS